MSWISAILFLVDQPRGDLSFGGRMILLAVLGLAAAVIIGGILENRDSS